jgi:hypothetical protein
VLIVVGLLTRPAAVPTIIGDQPMPNRDALTRHLEPSEVSPNANAPFVFGKIVKWVRKAKDVTAMSIELHYDGTITCEFGEVAAVFGSSRAPGVGSRCGTADPCG